ncbi:D-alanyl-D-alanine carboxypeptidase/D-alanyl-D-alanine endopeptidase [Saccharopolyspora rosea]|uniref:D-alanyl-D-alanine carboxypeptidase/D-alanyl-D-alanine endopeptidase n=1 Tax=Saccharopolyspora rosea TaxID=524884 RepID=UPI0021DA2FF7|nr:D-alanyl-D-alanine carboxypeptidase/D-alanyl-D-alanine-endopeptidase [Saccharopolyspora rosea]
MPEPQKARGEVSDTDVREPGPGSEREAVTAAADPEWPTEDQGAAASQATQPSTDPDGATDKPDDAAEGTAPPEAAEPDDAESSEDDSPAADRAGDVEQSSGPDGTSGNAPESGGESDGQRTDEEQPETTADESASGDDADSASRGDDEAQPAATTEEVDGAGSAASMERVVGELPEAVRQAAPAEREVDAPAEAERSEQAEDAGSPDAERVDEAEAGEPSAESAEAERPAEQAQDAEQATEKPDGADQQPAAPEDAEQAEDREQSSEEPQRAEESPEEPQRAGESAEEPQGAEQPSDEQSSEEPRDAGESPEEPQGAEQPSDEQSSEEPQDADESPDEPGKAEQPERSESSEDDQASEEPPDAAEAPAESGGEETDDRPSGDRPTDDRPTDEQERVVDESAEGGARGAEPSAVEATQQFRAVAAEPGEDGAAEPEQGVTQRTVPVAKPGDSGKTAVPPETQVEQTQRFAPIEQTQRIAPVRDEAPPESAAERTTRIDLGSIAPPADGRQTDQGPPTTRIPIPVEQPAERTQQFARPDFDEPRTASPEDFAGLAAPPRATPQRIEPRESPAPPPPPEPPRPDRAEQPDRGGRSRKKTLIGAAVAVVVLLGLGVAFGPGLVGGLFGPSIAAPPAAVTLDPAVKPLSRNAPQPDQAGIAAALAQPLSNPALGTFAGVVLDAETGRTIWQQNATTPLTPASTGKLVTMSAVLLALDHQERFSTKVVRGSTPGSVVLVGGGDPTLSSLPDGKESVYAGAAHLDDLAAQVRAATGGRVTSIQVDTSRYAGPSFAPGWLPEDVQAGFIAPMEPVMLDGGRADPTQENSTRSATPALQAARELGSKLGVSAVSQGTAPKNAQVLGEVKSPTVQDMVEMTLQHSDNVLAEALGRELAIGTGNEPSFAGVVKATREVLQRNGIRVDGMSMVDGSGLSLNDRIPPEVLGSLMVTANAPAGPEGGLPEKSAKLRSLLPGLPVAGGSGSLASRYQGEPGRGWVRAKTGTLDGANSLSGTVVTREGRLLAFALMSNGTSSAAARPALDALADALRGCGCR